MQRARCYLLGECAVVLELELPVSLEVSSVSGGWLEEADAVREVSPA